VVARKSLECGDLSPLSFVSGVFSILQFASQKRRQVAALQKFVFQQPVKLEG